MSSGKILLGVLAGVTAGAFIGILFAPDKGKNTRKKISKKGNDYAEELKSVFDDFLESITEKLESAKDDADDLIQKGKSKVKEVKSDVKNTLSEKVSHQH
ncbi:MAG: YtxH domain-containing protein [Saprospiraceae bacterium]